MPKENKTDRIGMRVSPNQKERWEATAHAWGYKSLAAWMSAMCDWAISYEDFESYEDYIKSLEKK